MSFLLPSNVHLCNSFLLLIILFICLPDFITHTSNQSPSNWSQESLCREGGIYCASSKTCLEVSCVYNFFNELEECPMGTTYCPATDECLYKCPTNKSHSNLVKYLHLIALSFAQSNQPMFIQFN